MESSYISVSAWDNMSGSQQLQVATAIVRKLKPDCGFVLIDKLEQMDQITLAEFGAWLENEGLQAIATRVSTGGECSRHYRRRAQYSTRNNRKISRVARWILKIKNRKEGKNHEKTEKFIVVRSTESGQFLVKYETTRRVHL